MNKFIVNIGLDSNVNNLSQKEIESMSLQALKDVKIVSTKKQKSNSENTLVLVVEATMQIYSLINNLCKGIEQDCIAVYSVNENEGDLIGPKASKWGKFNKEFFIF